MSTLQLERIPCLEPEVGEIVFNMDVLLGHG